MKKLSFYLSLILLSLAVVVPLTLLYSSLFYRPGPRASLEQDEQAVYTAVLANPDQHPFLFKEKTWTRGSDNWRDIHKNMPALSVTTYESYLARNRRPYPLSPDMKLGVQYHIISDAELNESYRISQEDPDPNQQNPMRELMRRYPGIKAVTQVSRVGFNLNRTEALVNVTYEIGPIYAISYLVRLERQAGTWKVVDSWGLWDSGVLPP